MGTLSILDLLPMLPWLGPPFPAFMRVYWPWVGQSSESRLLTALATEARSMTPMRLTPESHYSNEETWEIEWSSDGLPSKITVHRDARQQ